jgi:hypothetical protein
MRRIGRWGRLGRWVLAAGLAGAAGCLQFVSPVHPPPAELTESCQAVSSYGRRHVYVFLANGVDPLGLGNLAGVRQYLTALGFPKTYYGQTYHRHWIEKELRQAHKDDHDARFVLIGYGAGADTVRAVARSVCPDGIPIDLLITLQANPQGCLGGDLTPAAATQGAKGPCPLPEERMLGAPTDAQTLHVLAEELAQVAMRVPLVAPAELPLPAPAPGPGPGPEPETAPAPRPVNPGQVSAGDTSAGADPLRPVAQLPRYTLPPSAANLPEIRGPAEPPRSRVQNPYDDEEVVDEQDDDFLSAPPR